MNQRAVNLDELRKLVDNDQEGMAEIIRAFLEDIPKSLPEIRAMFEAHQWSSLQKKIHSVKAYYSYIGRRDLDEKLSLWERELANGEGIDRGALLVELEDHSRAIVTALDDILSRRPI